MGNFIAYTVIVLGLSLFGFALGIAIENRDIIYVINFSNFISTLKGLGILLVIGIITISLESLSKIGTDF